MKLVIIEDDILLSELVEKFLSEQRHIEVVNTFDSGSGFIAWLEQTHTIIDIILLDLKIKDENGADVAKYVKKNYPNIRVIVMSSHYKPEFTGFMLKLGISAFIPKGISKIELLNIISEVNERGFYFLPEQISVIRTQVSSKSPQPLIDPKNALSSREIDVLKLICEQKTAHEISDILYISKRTVEGHKNSLFLKTETKNMAGLVIYAIKHKYISVDKIPLIC